MNSSCVDSCTGGFFLLVSFKAERVTSYIPKILL